MNRPSCEALIMEVKKHEGLWNEQLGWFRAKQRRAWVKIGKKLYSTWDSPKTDQDQIICDMKRRWNKLRTLREDYKGMLNANETPKKRRPNNYKLLSFLDASLEDCQKTFDCEADVKPTLKNMSYSQVDLNEHSNHRESNTLNSTQGIQQNANENFLMSLLPDLEKMSREQNRDFKIATMTLIKNIFSKNTRECNNKNQGGDIIDISDSESESTENDNTSQTSANTSTQLSSTTKRSMPAPTMTRDSLPPSTPDQSTVPGRTQSRSSTPYMYTLQLFMPPGDPNVQENKETIREQIHKATKNTGNTKQDKEPEVIATIELVDNDDLL